MKIYTVSAITYDYYRFVELVVATTSYEKANLVAKEKSEYMRIPRHKEYPIIEDENASSALDSPETPHIIIQTWEDN